MRLVHSATVAETEIDSVNSIDINYCKSFVRSYLWILAWISNGMSELNFYTETLQAYFLKESTVPLLVSNFLRVPIDNLFSGHTLIRWKGVEQCKADMQVLQSNGT